MTEYRKFSSVDAEKLEDWWRGLDSERADRAQLRRASTSDDILITSAFSHFLQKMPCYWGVSEGKQGVSLSDAAAVAAVLARVKTSDKKNSFARSLALPKEGGSKAVMSELRFQQLQKSRTTEEFFTRICRAVDLLGGKANVVSLADDILHWSSEYRFGPASRPQNRLVVAWATDYYAAFKD